MKELLCSQNALDRRGPCPLSWQRPLAQRLNCAPCSVDALEDAEKQHAEQLRECQANLAELRRHIRASDTAHSKSEEIAASELKRSRQV